MLASRASLTAAASMWMSWRSPVPAETSIVNCSRDSFSCNQKSCSDHLRGGQRTTQIIIISNKAKFLTSGASICGEIPELAANKSFHRLWLLLACLIAWVADQSNEIMTSILLDYETYANHLGQATGEKLGVTDRLISSNLLIWWHRPKGGNKRVRAGLLVS